MLEVGAQNINGTVRDLFPSDYIGLDIVAAPGVDQVYDGHTIPFEDERFCTVLCLEVFEHCFDPVQLADEIIRVLAPDGIALISARGGSFPWHCPPDRIRFMPGYLLELFSRHGCVAMEMPDPEEDGWLVEVMK